MNLSAALSPDGQAKTLSDEARKALVNHSWPGNLRELRHEMQRATVLVGTRNVLEADDFSFRAALPSGPRTGDDATLHEKVEALEHREIEAALAKHDQNRTRTAEALGLSRQGLLNKIERYEL